MNDDSNDVIIDQQFYMQRTPGDLKWRLWDCGEESHCTDTLPEMREFVHGLWRGMSLITPVELTCAIFSDTGTLIDTMISKDMLGA